MTHSAQQLIHRALELLEQEDDLSGAESLLRDAIDLSLVATRTTELVRAHALLGEILLNTGREAEARSEFENVLALARAGLSPAEISEEVDAATHWLRELEKRS